MLTHHGQASHSPSKSGRAKRRVGVVALAAVALAAGVAPAASANTRATANSYISRPSCINVVPGDCSGFVAGVGLGVWMNCWEGGPQALGTGKWFNITVRSPGRGYGFTGFVPANAVANQWTSSPHC